MFGLAAQELEQVPGPDTLHPYVGELSTQTVAALQGVEELVG